MCGIIGILGSEDAAPAVLDALRRLEYRGYDSAGIATVGADGTLDRRRAVGKLRNLEVALVDDPLPGAAAIGHTRWATHGAPVEKNAHPHATSRVAVVHNGIIENFKTLRESLEKAGSVFETETDTETIAHLITRNLEQGMAPEAAFKAALKKLDGAFAIAVLFRGENDLIAAARRGSPLAVGRKNGAAYLGSDAYALAPFTNRVTYLEEGDWALLTRDRVRIFDFEDREIIRPERIADVSAAMVDKGQHRHFMAKEIYEQPDVVGHMIGAYADLSHSKIRLPEEIDLEKISKLTICACGTAYYAGLVGRYWLESLAGIDADTEVASELRYRDVPFRAGGAALFVSQSGETADTLAALKFAKEAGQTTIAIVNVPESSIAREADIVLPTHAGPEIGVASTKAFTCQLAALFAFAMAAGRARGVIDPDRERELVDAFAAAPRKMAATLELEDRAEDLSHEIAKARDAIYIGRGLSYPIALEGALKLKEISYIHAEGYAAGELKHGPIALIDENVPVIVVAPRDRWFEKTISNMQEVIARGGKVLLLSDAAGAAAAGDDVWATMTLPEVDPVLAPLIYALPVQLLAYFTAVAKGTDVDQPRNLAKSVTVE